MYIHRKLQNEDLEAICTFPQSEKEALYISPQFSYPLTPKQILDMLEERVAPTVIVDQRKSKVVAYANIYGYDPVEGTGWLGNVIVSPEYRGTGASTHLLNAMQDTARNELDIKTLKLACHNTNSRGLSFYTKCGFKPFDIKITNNKDKKLITIHMSKELT